MKRTTTGLVLLGCIILILGYDLFVVMRDHSYENSVSQWVYSMSHEFPVIPLLVGIVCGHFWFPMAKDKEN